MENAETIQIGEQIRYYRNLKNMSQEALALSAQITPAYVGLIERGLKSPTVNTLQKISSVLGISLAELFTPISLKEQYSSEIRSVDIERIIYSLNKLNDDELSMITQIILNIIKLKNM